ncbi:MAG: alpha/beta fold hydrolase [Alphaproteobacteria bacterium]
MKSPGKLLLTAIALAAASPVVTTTSVIAAEISAVAPIIKTHYRSETIDGIKIAYREAGDRTKPTLLLLHGFPTSSHMFRDVIPGLAAKYHVLAPDYPGFGASSMPPAASFEYSFANIANMIKTLLDRKDVNRYAVYVMDYGAPIGFPMFAENPERVTGFVIQNGNAYAEGLLEFWDPIKAY